LLIACVLASVACGRPQTVDDALADNDFRRAHRMLVPLAKQGDPAAQNQLGVMHYLGLGRPVDHRRAAHWFKRAALAGHGNAQRNLGSLFRQGLGVPRDDLRAFGWYDAARRHGNRRAEHYMQWMTQYVAWNQQAYARRIVAEDFKNKKVSECGEGLLMSACTSLSEPPGPNP
jgi:TPR repeat protein